MRIETYFQQLQQTIEACVAVQSFKLTYDKRSTHTGFVRGEIYFFDGSILHLREFADVEFTLDRLMYTYHYIDHKNKFVFRYDNTGHHKDLKDTFPHHKHDGGTGQTIASTAPNLNAVLQEIETRLILPS
ncbi:hypothetical protein HUU40_23125 [candidate division KSB1 bacterium]|nr:hypothetical protein [candidate division KSB1 bacterium]